MVSPCALISSIASCAPFSLSCPRAASGPVSGATWPILTVVALLAGAGAAAADAAFAPLAPFSLSDPLAGPLADPLAAPAPLASTGDAATTADAPAPASLSLFLLHAVAIATAAARVTAQANLIRIQ